MTGPAQQRPASDVHCPATPQRPAAAHGPAPQQRTVIDDAQLKRMMRSQEGFLQRNRHQLVTLILIAINVAVYLVEVALSGLRLDVPTSVLVSMGAMFPPLVQGPLDLYRFVVPMFLHMDLMHVLMNMVALYSVGVVLERILGKGNFILLYVAAGITGNVASYVAALVTGDVMTVSAGASTSVFGLFAAVALLGFVGRGDRRFLMAYSKGMLAVIVVNIAYSLLVPGISISGHLGGAAGGAIAMLACPSKNLRTPAALRAAMAVLWVAAMAAAIWWGLGAASAATANLLIG